MRGAACAEERTRRWAVLVTAAAAAVFLPTLRHGFVFDDVVEIVRNAYLGSLANLPEIFSGNSWAGAGMNNHTYRPLTVAGYALNHAVGGASPWSYHLVNVALHALVSWLVFRRALAWGLTRAAAGLGAMLFALHPVHVEAVANVAGRKDLLVALFALLALAAHARARARGGAWPALAWLVFGAAMFSKETGAVTLGLFVAQDVILGRRDSGVSGRRTAMLYAGHVIVLAGYLLVRWRVLGGFGIPYTHYYDNPVAEASAGVRWLTAIGVIGRGLLLQVAPVTLSPDYSYAVIPPVDTPANAWFLGTVVAGALLVAGAVAAARRGMKFGLFVLVWYGLTLLPASNLVLPVGTIFGERLLYLPSVGLCLAVGWLAARGIPRVPRTVGLAAVVAVLASLGARTLVYEGSWSSEIRLFRTAVRVVPRSTKVQLKFGDHLLEGGDAPGAAAAYRRALDIAPDNYKASLGLASALERLGRRDEAERLRAGVAVARPDNPDTLYALGAALRRRGDLEGAAEMWRRALAVDPDHVQSLGDLGSYYLRIGDRERAARYLERAVAVAPFQPVAWYNLGFLHEQAGRMTRARRAWRSFLRTAGAEYAEQRAEVERKLAGGR